MAGLRRWTVASGLLLSLLSGCDQAGSSGRPHQLSPIELSPTDTGLELTGSPTIIPAALPSGAARIVVLAEQEEGSTIRFSICNRGKESVRFPRGSYPWGIGIIEAFALADGDVCDRRPRFIEDPVMGPTIELKPRDCLTYTYDLAHDLENVPELLESGKRVQVFWKLLIYLLEHESEIIDGGMWLQPEE